MNKLGKKNNWTAYLYILPLLILSFALVYYCIINTVVVSFTDWDGMSDAYQLIGLKNYAKMLADPVFWKAVVNNIFFFIGTVFIQALLGFFLAVLLKKSCRVLIFLKPFISCRLRWQHLLLRLFLRLLWIRQTER